jgi:HD-GYP domain-containing protein (c-di-GMP phosphodiesterase class II)
MRPLQDDDVVLGQALISAVFDIEGKLLLERGHVVRSEGLRAALLERGFLQEPQTPEPAAEPAAPETAPLTTSLAVQRSIFDGIRELLDALAQVQLHLLRAEAGALADLLHLYALLRRYAERDVDAALAALQLSPNEDGFSARPLHGALLVRVLGDAAGLSPSDIDSLACAALTHDLALLPQAQTLHHQREPVSPQQRMDIDHHTLQSAELLRAAGVEDALWLDAVLHHHERLDGSGYPHRLAGAAISTGARIVTLVDTYCAMIRPRAYRGPVQSKDALRALFLERGTAVDEALTALFVKQVGLYPPGGLVRLASNEIAVVVRRGSTGTQPEVRRLLKSDSMPDPERLRRDTADARYAVAESLSQDSYRALLRGIERLWD